MPKHKILLVDDVEFFLEVERDFLRHTPAAILVASNGIEALEVARRERPDLIFLDALMPEMDGFDCCRALKADPALCHIPVVMVTAANGPDHEATCRAAGCDEVVSKPIDRRIFLDVGHRFLFHIERREPRVFCQLLVTFWRGEEEFSASGEDLSRKGMYLACRAPVRLKEVLPVRVLLPGGGAPVECRVRVAWLNQGFPRPKMELPQGFGAEICEIPEEDAARVETAVAAIRKAGGKGVQ